MIWDAPCNGIICDDLTDLDVTLIHRSPLLQMEEERKEHMTKMKKMEAEMEQVFEMKVKEKKQKLKDSETDVSKTKNNSESSLCQSVGLFY